MLSAQTTDVNVNKVTEKLFVKYRRPEDYLAVPQEELERDIYRTGFFRQKARSIRGTMRMLIEEFDGQVPRRLEELVRLPGVARKTANVVAAELGDPQGIVVDTHVRRLSQRLGLTRHEDPVKIERDLAKLVPRSEWGLFPHLLIWHGRRVCVARAPRCPDCVLVDLCPASRV
jgi:endonuclease-3